MWRPLGMKKSPWMSAADILCLFAIVGPKGDVIAEDPSNNESVIEAESPIAKFRQGRTIPRYPLEVVRPVFDQYRQELPLNHLDLPPEKLPPSNKDMKDYLDSISRWMHRSP